MNRTPGSLLERLREASDPDAWNRFVQLYTPLLYHFARRIGLQEADVADLVQDVFLLLYRKMPEFVYKPGKSFRAWLRTLTINHWRNRREKRQTKSLQDDHLLGSDPGLEFEEAEYRRHLIDRALRVIRSDFEPMTWELCWAAVTSGQRAEEIARQHAVSIDVVYVSKMRVLKRLRTELEGLMD